jgi:hypothetical protein
VAAAVVVVDVNVAAVTGVAAAVVVEAVAAVAAGR